MSENPASTQNRSSRRSLRALVAPHPVWLVGVLATVAGAVVTEVFSLIARGLGVSMEAASPGADTAQEIPPFGFAMGVLSWAVIGIVLAMALAKWAKHPARPFFITTVALTALSLAGPAAAPHTDTSTQIVLAVSHLIAAAVIIPPLTLRLAQRQRNGA